MAEYPAEYPYFTGLWPIQGVMQKCAAVHQGWKSGFMQKSGSDSPLQLVGYQLFRP
jgi:hypothetical protein